MKDNINNFLFTFEEFASFQEKRLPKVYEEYQELLEIKKRLKELKEHSSVRNVYDELPNRIKVNFFRSAAKKFLKQQYGILDL